MLTGRSQEKDFEEAKDSAADAYILKPYKQELIIEKINNPNSSIANMGQ